MEKKFSELTYGDLNKPRYRRARDFTNSVLNLMQDFIPRSGRCLSEIERHIIEIAYDSDIAIVHVLPEWDEMTAAQISLAMLQIHPAMVKIPVDTAS